MKKTILITICLTMLFTACNKNNKAHDNSAYDENTNKKMYVWATYGVTVRDTPSIDGAEIGSLEYLTEVNVTKESEEKSSVKDPKIRFEGRMVYINSPIKGWVFNGYLGRNHPLDNRMAKNIIGSWTEPGGAYGDRLWIFNENGTFNFQNIATQTKGNWIYGVDGIELSNVLEDKYDSDWRSVDDFNMDVELVDDKITTYFKLSVSYSVRTFYNKYDEENLELERFRE